MCTVALPPALPPANIWSICCISCCWAGFGGVPALPGEEAGFSVVIPPGVGMPGVPPGIKLVTQKNKAVKTKKSIHENATCECICMRANLGMRPGASVCSVCKPCWICIRACMARGLVITDMASGFCICIQTDNNRSISISANVHSFDRQKWRA